MTSKIFRTTILVAAIVLLCSLVVIMGFLYNYFATVQEGQLQDELSLAVGGTELSGISFLETAESERFRLTWVAADGTVLYDTHAAAETMENHASREEIKEALLGGYGSSSRYSDTLTERTMYEAKRLSDGSVLRISVSQATPAALVLDLFYPVIIIALIAIALSAMLARKMSQKITEPLNKLDLEHPLENNTYEELSPLLNRINQQHNEISAQLKKLKRKTDEFQQITANMSEGLVLLDRHKTVVSINPAAKALFGTDHHCIGKDFLMVDRSQELRTALDAALEQGRKEVTFWKNGRQHQLVFSRIESGGSVIGVVVLTFDSTEQFNAERTRREFTANVSHELKTPLQSIMGSAELLENGLVQQADMPRFVGHIRKEASRLVNLVEDIIRLSRLDEGVDIPTESVDLYDLAEEAISALQPAAVQKSITFSLSGTPCTICGVRGLLYEILHNLCDNAVKYNKDGGSVTVSIAEENGHPTLRVSDTGIGIPQEHQNRVFERFYRVDKSHSKQSGGTGLGLSIVKHAVAYHNAQLELESIPGEGTTITVVF